MPTENNRIESSARRCSCGYLVRVQPPAERCVMTANRPKSLGVGLVNTEAHGRGESAQAAPSRDGAAAGPGPRQGIFTRLASLSCRHRRTRAAKETTFRFAILRSVAFDCGVPGHIPASLCDDRFPGVTSAKMQHRQVGPAETQFDYPNKSMIGLPVVREREIPLASCGLLTGMSRA